MELQKSWSGQSGKQGGWRHQVKIILSLDDESRHCPPPHLLTPIDFKLPEEVELYLLAVAGGRVKLIRIINARC